MARKVIDPPQPRLIPPRQGRKTQQRPSFKHLATVFALTVINLMTWSRQSIAMPLTRCVNSSHARERRAGSPALQPTRCCGVPAASLIRPPCVSRCGSFHWPGKFPDPRGFCQHFAARGRLVARVRAEAPLAPSKPKPQRGQPITQPQLCRYP